MATQSHWQQTALPQFPALSKSEQVDVLVVGGGCTGIMTAYLLKKAGLSVALVERSRCAQSDTGSTTAHLTCVTDLRLAALVQRFGRDHAQAVWDGGLAALQQIEEIIAEEDIACDFAHVPGHLHASLTGDRDERDELIREADLAQELGFEAEFVDSVPIFGRPGVRYPNQAVFHPLKYLAELITRVHGGGSHVYEMTEADEFEVAGSGKINVQACGRVIQCDAVVMATDVPLTGLSSVVSAAALQTKITGYTSYAVGATLPMPSPSPACFWDSSDPYYYLRIDRSAGDGYAVFGGLDHKTGQTDDTVGRFDRLEEMLHRFLPQARVDRRWSGQVIESHDGLPFIGETAQRQFIATGFSGNGITFGTLGAIMIRDAILGRPNPWRELFSPDRKPLRGAWNYLVEHAEYPYYMVKDRLAASEGQSLSALPRGTGKILRLDGKRVAAYRADDGKVTLVSPVCTHLGCLVHWNQAERSWDCPCHGSRFDHTGEVITGPAETPLKAIDPY